MFDSAEFDSWAQTYDSEVIECDDKNAFPFAGYHKLMQALYDRVSEKASSRVLDVGIGTGILSAKLYESGHIITGTDYSSEMLRISREKMPNAELIKWDFTKSVPDSIGAEKFDFVISTYALHHLTDDEKLRLISELMKLLDTNGTLLIADIGFADSGEMTKCKETFPEEWDDEYYFMASELLPHFDNLVSYQQISHCCMLLEFSGENHTQINLM